MPLLVGNNNVSIFKLKKDNNEYNLSNFLIGNSTVWSSGGVTPNSYFTFTLLDDDTYSIAAADVTNMPVELILPSEYEGKPVTRVADYAFVDPYSTDYNQTTKRIVIPDSITTIGSYAFAMMLTVTEITWGANLVNIGNNAFQYCVSLTSITIPDSVTTIDEDAFFGCSKLTSVIIGDGVISIGSQAFRDCDKLRSVEIGASVTSIGIGAFSSCSSLDNVVISDGVTSIGSSAFIDCSNLTIYCEAESQPEGWDSSWNPDSRPVIWDYNLLGDEYFAFTELEDGTYSVKATDVSNLPSEIGIPFSYNGKAVTAIEYSAFKDCSNLTRVVIPYSITSIGAEAFYGCTNLISVVIPNSVDVIGKWAFVGRCAPTIYCEAPSRPDGWNDSWNPDGWPVVWGYTG